MDTLTTTYPVCACIALQAVHLLAAEIARRVRGGGARQEAKKQPRCRTPRAPASRLHLVPHPTPNPTAARHTQWRTAHLNFAPPPPPWLSRRVYLHHLALRFPVLEALKDNPKTLNLVAAACLWVSAQGWAALETPLGSALQPCKPAWAARHGLGRVRVCVCWGGGGGGVALRRLLTGSAAGGRPPSPLLTLTPDLTQVQRPHRGVPQRQAHGLRHT